jgi:hypothetical protein
LFALCIVSRQKKMKICFSIALFLILFQFAGAQHSGTKVTFRGGMMLHLGYLHNARTVQTIGGTCNGIGGQLSFTLGNNFRLGTEGYASNLGYKEQDGYFKLGWGGLLLAYQFGNRKIHPVIGITLGGGKVKDMYFIQGSVTDEAIDEVIFRKYGVMLASPAVSIEYALKT